MTIKINPDNLTEQGKETLRNWLEESLLGKEKVEDQAEKKIAETFVQEPEPEIKHSRELPKGLPDYAYEVDENFKNETGNNRNPDMMKKIDDAVLQMRKDGILKTKPKDGGVYTTINFPNEKPIHFLEPDLIKHSDDDYKYSYNYSFGGGNIHKNEVKLSGMKWNIDEWKNQKLKQYVKQSGLHLPERLAIQKFMQKLADYVNQKYGLGISTEQEQMDLFCRSMNSIGEFWLCDFDDRGPSRSFFRCLSDGRWFGSDGLFNSSESFFLSDCLL